MCSFLSSVSITNSNWEPIVVSTGHDNSTYLMTEPRMQRAKTICTRGTTKPVACSWAHSRVTPRKACLDVVLCVFLSDFCPASMSQELFGDGAKWRFLMNQRACRSTESVVSSKSFRRNSTFPNHPQDPNEPGIWKVCSHRCWRRMNNDQQQWFKQCGWCDDLLNDSSGVHEPPADLRPFRDTFLFFCFILTTRMGTRWTPIASWQQFKPVGKWNSVYFWECVTKTLKNRTFSLFTVLQGRW